MGQKNLDKIVHSPTGRNKSVVEAGAITNPKVEISKEEVFKEILEMLPDELLFEIILFFQLNDILSVFIVSKRIYEYCSTKDFFYQRLTSIHVPPFVLSSQTP